MITEKLDNVSKINKQIFLFEKLKFVKMSL